MGQCGVSCKTHISASLPGARRGRDSGYNNPVANPSTRIPTARFSMQEMSGLFIPGIQSHTLFRTFQLVAPEDVRIPKSINIRDRKIITIRQLVGLNVSKYRSINAIARLIYPSTSVAL